MEKAIGERIACASQPKKRTTTKDDDEEDSDASEMPYLEF